MASRNVKIKHTGHFQRIKLFNRTSSRLGPKLHCTQKTVKKKQNLLDLDWISSSKNAKIKINTLKINTLKINTLEINTLKINTLKIKHAENQTR